MAKPKTGTLSAATLEPVKAIPALEKLIAEGEQLRSEGWTSPKRQQFATTGEGLLLAGLGSGHPAIQIFRGAQCGSYGPGDTETWLMQQANGQLDNMIAVLRSVVDQLRWQLPDPTEVFLTAGSTHDAYVEIRNIVQRASSELVIVDSYVDHTLWPFLKNVPGTAKLRILTMNMKGDFVLEAKKFANQHGNVVEIRQTSNYHDRFILVDGKQCWHLGASIKDAGSKAFAMSEILSSNIRSTIQTDVEATWNAGTVVSI
ncbi:MAG TPA: hypothetical protein VN950_03660 [Terriglobales bacterium]|nr:hypothetical protein [Terriglobales bacterium]